MKKYQIHVFILTAFFFLASCAKNPVTGKREVMFMSEQQEVALGKQYDPTIVASYGLYEDEKLQKFINDKGQEMARISHRPQLNYEFKIMDSPVINAFAVPGGYVYFTRGILAHFNNEAEFAGVLGHEIGHITARHSAKQQTNATLAQLGLMVGVVASKEFRQFANQAQQGLQLLFLKFGRDNESQSDRLGVEYSTKIGYDSHHMANFFKTLHRMRAQNSEAASLPTFLSTHPDPLDRYQKVGELTKEWQAKDTQKSSYQTNRDSYLKMIDGLIYGEDPRQGYVENNYFYHPELKFQFPVPQGWRVQNSPQQVTMGPADGKAMVMLRLAQGNSTQEAANTFVTENKLTALESKNIQVNGLPATVVLSEQRPTAEQQQQAQQAGQQVQIIRIMSYMIQYNNLIYGFHGLSLREDFDRYANQLSIPGKNFNRLTDASKINVTPNKIRIKPAPVNGTFTQVMNALKVPQKQQEELSILNSMELNQQIKKGTLLKTIGK